MIQRFYHAEKYKELYGNPPRCERYTMSMSEDFFTDEAARRRCELLRDG